MQQVWIENEMLNPDVLFGHSASRVKGCGSPTRGRKAARKSLQGGEELINSWVTFLLPQCGIRT